ncbi:MAG: hypothetical protein M3Y48_06620 [Actinomycetota bacterium]|nr:hypothetical protein [Actinomycetota bacterium]MDQ2880926.1 hypothetical protein [Actinomycetota bacterium]
MQGDQPDGHDPVVGDAEAGALLVCTHRLLATASGELSSGGIRVRRPLGLRRGHYELGTEEVVNLRVLAAFDELALAI